MQASNPASPAQEDMRAFDVKNSGLHGHACSFHSSGTVYAGVLHSAGGGEWDDGLASRPHGGQASA